MNGSGSCLRARRPRSRRHRTDPRRRHGAGARRRLLNPVANRTPPTPRLPPPPPPPPAPPTARPPSPNPIRLGAGGGQPQPRPGRGGAGRGLRHQPPLVEHLDDEVLVGPACHSPRGTRSPCAVPPREVPRARRVIASSRITRTSSGEKSELFMDFTSTNSRKRRCRSYTRRSPNVGTRNSWRASAVARACHALTTLSSCKDHAGSSRLRAPDARPGRRWTS